MKLKTIILTLLLGFFNTIFSQTINIQGKVSDLKTNQPVSGAFVFINYNYSTYTNNQGIFTISDIRSGKYEIKISRLGYKLYSKELTIESSS
ncbi:MAG TPA: carboxypeptidase-like regulatory domain-containing protein, partial [Ignavibacteriaceae bacterium]|nr:carboxypeptidase-like regulatory domain-containing protein [Ignavibacteriaceae bacterium]